MKFVELKKIGVRGEGDAAPKSGRAFWQSLNFSGSSRQQNEQEIL